jgi:hypothetical protein
VRKKSKKNILIAALNFCLSVFLGIHAVVKKMQELLASETLPHGTHDSAKLDDGHLLIICEVSVCLFGLESPSSL